MTTSQQSPDDGAAAGRPAPRRPLIGINTFVWHSPIDTAQLTDVARRIAGWGFDAIEIPLEQEGDWDPVAAREVFDEVGLTPIVGAVWPPGRELVAAPADVVARTQGYVRHCVDVAVAAGAPCVIGPIYASVGRLWRTSPDERRAMMDDLREALRAPADYAGERGVKLAVEPLNRFETSVLNTTAQALELIDGLPPESVGLNLDTFHMNIEEKSIPDALRAAGDRLVHLHTCGNDRGAPGRDHIDWDGIRAALLEIGFAGAFGIESFTPDNETIATAAAIGRPQAESPDALAQDGLAFLRRLTADWGA
ncbi:MAG: D-psicose/D-tagatose/L-ribulose 3-epimerase [Solirubrobacteraceae bacterium]|nr:D-psicose/D-tagatose/L-ribulose 3-epimerase [Solirubrobacteraceae bacterium]